MKKFSAMLLYVTLTSSLTYAQSSVTDNPIVGPNQIVITGGFMVANSLIGGEAELCLNNRLGIELGVGFIGAGGGVNLHLYTTEKDDYYFNLEGKYMPVLGFLPAIEFGARSFFGESKKFGLGAEIGIGIHTSESSFTVGSQTYEFHKGDSMLTYSLGLVVNL
ncbi:hypothetical protein KAW50_00670 [candidate division WOR-3 bacterium]|nr:hypothetical protein [candidate division WOR-3 bacterium]